ncbi:MAG TPA: RES family NAD+ phosphorylase [Flavisolibacter sp.]|nr:RES family NAD+ phosphorylase [Flavisolibacter sp.]
MFVYRIVQNRSRATDLSGTGAFQYGGRWNSKGTYLLYTSENSSLAYLESIVHFDPIDFPSQLFIITIQIDDEAPIFMLPDKDYPGSWLQPGLHANQAIGDRLMAENKFLGIRVRSAVNVMEYNCLLNPLFPGFQNLVRVVSVNEIDTDKRLMG